MRYPLPGVVLVLTVVALPAGLCAQQTIFNVPSADVLEAGKGDLETDQYFCPWGTDSGRAASFFFRGVVGVGSPVEVRIHTGPFDYLHQSNPFIVFAGKWRPFLLEFGDAQQPGAFGLYGGTDLGVGLGGEVKGDFYNLTYGVMSLRLPVLATRLGVGPYF